MDDTPDLRAPLDADVFMEPLDAEGRPTLWVAVEERLYCILLHDPPTALLTSWPCSNGNHRGLRTFPGHQHENFVLRRIVLEGELAAAVRSRLRPRA